MSLARNTLLYLPAQVVGPVAQFVVTVLWTHLVAPSAFGVVTFVMAAQELTGGLGLVWWSIFVIRFQGRYAGPEAAPFKRMDSKVVLAAVMLQCALAAPALLMIGAPLSLGLVVASAGYLATRTLLNHYSEWSRARHKFAVYTFAQLGGQLAGAALSLLAALKFGSEPAAILAGLALGQGAVLLVVTRALGVPWIGAGFDSAVFLSAWRYGLPLVASGVLTWVATNFARLAVQYALGPDAFGVFSAGWG